MNGQTWQLEPPPPATVLPQSGVVAMPTVPVVPPPIEDGSAKSSCQRVASQQVVSLVPPGLQLRGKGPLEVLLDRIEMLEKRVTELEKHTKMPVGEEE